MMWEDHISMERGLVVYSAGDQVRSCCCITKEFVAHSLNKAGYCDVHIQYWPINFESSDTPQVIKEKPGMMGYFVVSAKNCASKRI